MGLAKAEEKTGRHYKAGQAANYALDPTEAWIVAYLQF